MNGLLNTRIYRVAFIPSLLALVVAAFSFHDRPVAKTTPLASDAFEKTRAFGADQHQPAEQGGRLVESDSGTDGHAGGGSAAARIHRGADPTAGITQPRNSLLELAATFPTRSPGSRGDSLLAERVAETFSTLGLKTSRRETETNTSAGKKDITTVIGIRPGVSPRRIVVVAQRDSRSGRSIAKLSATAALIELARVFKLRQLNKTLVLVSTSGSEGGAGVQRVAKMIGRPSNVDAVVVVGDVASSSKPTQSLVIPWSNRQNQPSLGFRRTVEAALQRETTVVPMSTGIFGQWVRRAVPLTISSQGQLAGAGFQAVMVQVSGEIGPGSKNTVSAERMIHTGKGIVRVISVLGDPKNEQGITKGALHGSAGETKHIKGSNTKDVSAKSSTQSNPVESGIIVGNKVMPDWSIRLFTLTLLIPVVVVAIDAFARSYRRRLNPVGWLLWVLVAGALPLALMWGWLRLMSLLGGIVSPPAPVLPEPVGVTFLGCAAVLSTLAIFVVARMLLSRGLLHELGRDELAHGGAGCALGICIAIALVTIWIINPFAAAVAIPAAHLWIFATTFEGQTRGWRAWAIYLAGFLPLVVIGIYYLKTFEVDPLTFVWSLFLATAGGYISMIAMVIISIGGGVAISAAQIIRASSKAKGLERPEQIRTRGPVTYAGPGSLGGTGSALSGGRSRR